MLVVHCSAKIRGVCHSSMWDFHLIREYAFHGLGSPIPMFRSQYVIVRLSSVVNFRGLSYLFRLVVVVTVGSFHLRPKRSLWVSKFLITFR